MENKIYFENGIVHTFTSAEIKMLKLSVRMSDVNVLPLFGEYFTEEDAEALENLKSLFDHLD